MEATTNYINKKLFTTDDLINNMNRRNLLLSVGATSGLVAVAGCSSSQNGEETAEEGTSQNEEETAEEDTNEFIQRSCSNAELVVPRIVEVDATTIDIVLENRSEDPLYFQGILVLREDGRAIGLSNQSSVEMDPSSSVSREIEIDAGPSSVAQVATNNIVDDDWENHTEIYRTACIEREGDALSAKNLNVTGGWERGDGEVGDLYGRIKPNLEFENPTGEAITTLVGYYITINNELVKMGSSSAYEQAGPYRYIAPARVPPNETASTAQELDVVSYRFLTEEQINASSDSIELVAVIENEVVARLGEV